MSIFMQITRLDNILDDKICFYYLTTWSHDKESLPDVFLIVKIFDTFPNGLSGEI